MYSRKNRSTTILPATDTMTNVKEIDDKNVVSTSNVELQETTPKVTATDDPTKEKKHKRFKSPMRHIFKLKEQTTPPPPPYYRLKEEQQYTDSQFKEKPPKAPVQAIILATVLFIAGSIMITLGALMLTGYIKTQYSDRTWPLILVGTILFLPGFFHVRIAYWAYKGSKGFSFEDIPDLDWF